MDAFCDRWVKEVVAMLSAQVGKTTMAENVTGYFVHLRPTPIMVVHKRQDDSEKFSKERISDMVKTTPVLDERFHKASSRDSGNTILHKQFRGGSITMAPANSPDSLRGRPVGLVIGDELSAWEDTPQGDPVELVEARQIRFPNAKRGYFSTPGIAGLCKISKKYELSDKRRYHVPCPHCREYSVLAYEAIEGVPTSPLTWAEGDSIRMDNGQLVRTAKEAWFQCVHCSEKINDAQRAEANLQGEWRASAKFRGRAGFWAWEANYPGSMAITFANKWLGAQGNVKELQSVKNQVFGLPWKETGVVMEWRKLMDRCESYKLTTVPVGVKVLFGAVDVQKDRLEIYVYGYGDNMQQWLIDQEVIEGDPDQAATWQKLSNFINAVAYPDTEGNLFHVFRWAVDSGYLAGRVYEWSAKFPPDMVYVVKGEESGAGFWKRGVALEAGPSGGKYKTGHYLHLLSKMQLIDRFYSWLSQPPPTWEALEKGEPYPTGYLHTPKMPEEYFRQLTADVKIGGKYKDKVNFHRNEALDCKTYCDFLADISWVARYEAAKVPLPTVTANPHQSVPQQAAAQQQAPQRRIRGRFGN